jgi:hypothetical protein
VRDVEGQAAYPERRLGRLRRLLVLLKGAVADLA